MTKELELLIKQFSATFGEVELTRLLETRLNYTPHEEVLTVICDDTMHQIPNELIAGESFILSTGNFNTSSGKAIADYITSRIIALCEVLNARRWSRVRLIYSGHAILAATAKLAIYRVTHIETDDVLYFGGVGYLEMTLRLRDILVSRRSL